MIDPEIIGNLTQKEKLAFLSHLNGGDIWNLDLDEVLVRLVRDPSPEVRREALAVLADFTGLTHGALLMELASRDASLEVRSQAVSSLAAYVYGAVIECELDLKEYRPVRLFLMDLVRNESEPVPVRARAIESLAYDDDENVSKLIEWTFAQPEPQLQLAAMAAMGHGGLERWTGHILDHLYAEDPAMRLQAIRAAAEACIEDATPQLRNLALSGDREARLTAIDALAYTAGPGSLETLELCEKSDDPEISAAAAEAIGTYEAYRDAELDSEGFVDIEEEEEDDDDDDG